MKLKSALIVAATMLEITTAPLWASSYHDLTVSTPVAKPVTSICAIGAHVTGNAILVSVSVDKSVKGGYSIILLDDTQYKGMPVITVSSTQSAARQAADYLGETVGYEITLVSVNPTDCSEKISEISVIRPVGK